MNGAGLKRQWSRRKRRKGRQHEHRARNVAGAPLARSGLCRTKNCLAAGAVGSCPNNESAILAVWVLTMIISAAIFNEAFRDLSIYEKALFLYLAVRTNEKTGQCNPSHMTIREDMSICDNTLLKSFKGLTRKGFLKRIPGAGRGHTTQYEIIPARETGISDDGNRRNTLMPCDKIPSPHEGQKREVKKKNVRTVFSDDSFEHKLAEKLWISIQQSGTSQKPPDFQQWGKVFDLMHRIDKRPYHFILLTMTKAREDDFWRQNLRSPETLRKQLDAGKLDRFTPATGEYFTDEQLIEQEARSAA